MFGKEIFRKSFLPYHPGDARHRRLVVSVVCSVETGNQFVKRFHSVFAKKAIPSPYANAFGFAPAFA